MYTYDSIFSARSAGSIRGVTMFPKKTIVSHPTHRDLFNLQIQTLKNRGCPAKITDAYAEAEKKIIEYAESIIFLEDHLLFMPVIPLYYIGYYGLASLMRYDDDTHGDVYMDLSLLEDVKETPRRPYYIFNVEDGTEMIDRTPETAAIIIRQQNRFSATAAEAMNIAIHTDVLSHHSIGAVASRYGLDRTPIVWLNVQDPLPFVGRIFMSYIKKPGLGWRYTSTIGSSGAASYGSRLEI